MARLARLVLPGYPYHVTQRGNRRQPVFFEKGDNLLYRDLLADAAERAGAQVWCYCLMPNHVHLIVVPADEDGLRRTFADAHRSYTSFNNARHRWPPTRQAGQSPASTSPISAARIGSTQRSRLMS